MGHRKGHKSGDKWCVARHRSMPRSEANRLERRFEKIERRKAREEIELATLEDDWKQAGSSDGEAT